VGEWGGGDDEDEDGEGLDEEEKDPHGGDWSLRVSEGSLPGGLPGRPGSCPCCKALVAQKLFVEKRPVFVNSDGVLEERVGRVVISKARGTRSLLHSLAAITLKNPSLAIHGIGHADDDWFVTASHYRFAPNDLQTSSLDLDVMELSRMDDARAVKILRAQKDKCYGLGSSLNDP